jgi:hypothetical protein
MIKSIIEVGGRLLPPIQILPFALLVWYQSFDSLDDVIGANTRGFHQLVGGAGTGHGLNGKFDDLR